MLGPAKRRTGAVTRRGLFGAAAAVGVAAGKTAGAAAPRRAPPAAMKLGCQQGPTTEPLLRFFARHGVRNICGSLPDRTGQAVHGIDELRRLHEQCAAQGISLDMIRLPLLRPS